MEVRVGLDGQTDVAEDLVMVGPCWRAEVDSGGRVDFAVELGEEQSSQVDSPGSRDGLEGSYSFLFYCGRIGAEDELLCRGGEGSQACDGQILVVELGILPEDVVGLAICVSWPAAGGLSYNLAATYLLDDGQDPGLCIVVSVSSNAQVDLLVEGVGLVGGHEAKQRVLGCLRHNIGSKNGAHVGWRDVGCELGQSGRGRRR